MMQERDCALVKIANIAADVKGGVGRKIVAYDGG
jgi:hypothetical protein